MNANNYKLRVVKNSTDFLSFLTENFKLIECTAGSNSLNIGAWKNRIFKVEEDLALNLFTENSSDGILGQYAFMKIEKSVFDSRNNPYISLREVLDQNLLKEKSHLILFNIDLFL